MAMLAVALQADVATYVEAHAVQVDAEGHRLVVRHGYHQAREVTTSASAVPVRAAGQRPAGRRCDRRPGAVRLGGPAGLGQEVPQVAEVLPLLYLHGRSSSDVGPALEQFLGSAAGLSAATITRLIGQWQDDDEAFNKRSLTDTDYVYCWVDGIQLKVRLEQDKVCLLVTSVSDPTGPRSWSPSPTGYASLPSRGPTRAACASAEACGPRCWRSGSCAEVLEGAARGVPRGWWHKMASRSPTYPRSAGSNSAPPTRSSRPSPS